MSWTPRGGARADYAARKIDVLNLEIVMPPRNTRVAVELLHHDGLQGDRVPQSREPIRALVQSIAFETRRWPMPEPSREFVAACRMASRSLGATLARESNSVAWP